jgi:hypothetical protein
MEGIDMPPDRNQSTTAQASLDPVIVRLNVIINLLLDATEKPVAQSLKIGRLDELGLGPSEIAAIVGKKSNYVSAVLNERKKRKPRRAV